MIGSDADVAALSALGIPTGLLPPVVQRKNSQVDHFLNTWMPSQLTEEEKFTFFTTHGSYLPMQRALAYALDRTTADAAGKPGVAPQKQSSSSSTDILKCLLTSIPSPRPSVVAALGQLPSMAGSTQRRESAWQPTTSTAATAAGRSTRTVVLDEVAASSGGSLEDTLGAAAGQPGGILRAADRHKSVLAQKRGGAPMGGGSDSHAVAAAGVPSAEESMLSAITCRLPASPVEGAAREVERLGAPRGELGDPVTAPTASNGVVNHEPVFPRLRMTIRDEREEPFALQRASADRQKDLAWREAKLAEAQALVEATRTISGELWSAAVTPRAGSARSPAPSSVSGSAPRDAGADPADQLLPWGDIVFHLERRIAERLKKHHDDVAKPLEAASTSLRTPEANQTSGARVRSARSTASRPTAGAASKGKGSGKPKPAAAARAQLMKQLRIHTTPLPVNLRLVIRSLVLEADKDGCIALPQLSNVLSKDPFRIPREAVEELFLLALRAPQRPAWNTLGDFSLLAVEQSRVFLGSEVSSEHNTASTLNRGGSNPNALWYQPSGFNNSMTNPLAGGDAEDDRLPADGSPSPSPGWRGVPPQPSARSIVRTNSITLRQSQRQLGASITGSLATSVASVATISLKDVAVSGRQPVATPGVPGAGGSSQWPPHHGSGNRGTFMQPLAMSQTGAARGTNSHRGPAAAPSSPPAAEYVAASFVKGMSGAAACILQRRAVSGPVSTASAVPGVPMAPVNGPSTAHARGSSFSNASTSVSRAIQRSTSMATQLPPQSQPQTPPQPKTGAGVRSASSGPTVPKAPSDREVAPVHTHETITVRVQDIATVLDEILNPTVSDLEWIRVASFRVLADEGNGYIHRAILEKHKRERFPCEREQSALTGCMVKALSDVFTALDAEDEQLRAGAAKGRRKGKGGKRGPAAAAPSAVAPPPVTGGHLQLFQYFNTGTNSSPEVLRITRSDGGNGPPASTSSGGGAGGADAKAGAPADSAAGSGTAAPGGGAPATDIPRQPMRRSHIDYETFCRFFDTRSEAELSACFMRIWLPYVLRRASSRMPYPLVANVGLKDCFTGGVDGSTALVDGELDADRRVPPRPIPNSSPYAYMALAPLTADDREQLASRIIFRVDKNPDDTSNDR